MAVRSITIARGRSLIRSHADKALILLAEVGAIVVVYELYTAARWSVAGDDATAFRHGRAVLRLEESLGFACERFVQRIVLHLPWLVWVCNGSYVALHRPFLVTAALIVYLRDRTCYRRMRTAFVLSCGVGLLVFWLLPVAPPRLLPGAGFVDTLKRDWPSASSQPSARVNQFAAIPSFHVGWNALAVWSLMRVTPHRRLRLLLAGIPALMLLTVVVTANHYLLDAVVGVLVVAGCYRSTAGLTLDHLVRLTRFPRNRPCHERAARPSALAAAQTKPPFPRREGGLGG